jgi:integrase
MSSNAGFYKVITTRTAKWFGQPVNPHLFRNAAATSIAIEDSAHVGIVRTILGHSSFRTAEKYYNKATSINAARRYQNYIGNLRRTPSRR